MFRYNKIREGQQRSHYLEHGMITSAPPAVVRLPVSSDMDALHESSGLRMIRRPVVGSRATTIKDTFKRKLKLAPCAVPGPDTDYVIKGWAIVMIRHSRCLGS